MKVISRIDQHYITLLVYMGIQWM